VAYPATAADNLMMKRDLLQGILDNKRYEFEPYDDVQGGVAYTNYRKKGDPVGETRGYTREGEPGVLWYWLDYEREWP
jgi:hypothetical protein